MLKLVSKVLRVDLLDWKYWPFGHRDGGRVVGCFFRLTNWAAAWPMEMEERDAGFLSWAW